MITSQYFPKLFEPGRIGTLRLKNRIVMPPMGTKFADKAGFVTERMKDYYAERAKGGVALVITETFCVDGPRGQAITNQPRIDDDRYIPGLRQLAHAIQKHHVKAVVQLHHAGHATTFKVTGHQPVGPSTLARPGFDQPRGLTTEEIQGITGNFVQAAKRAQLAGFDGVEIHAAHQYLFAQFLSTAWNKRQDNYGGDLSNRARFLVETVRAIRDAVGTNYPMWCRINGVEIAPVGGIPPEESQIIARLLQDAGSDAIHVSACSGTLGPHGNMHRVPMSEPGGNLIPLAEGIRKVVNIPVIAVGRIAPELGEKALQEKRADFIAMGRALIADPELPNKAAYGAMAEIRPCIACNECVEYAIYVAGKLRCAVNPGVGKEREYVIRPAAKKKRVLIIGGGPAGMEAARVLALQGHLVNLCDKNSQLGGQMLLAALPPHKEAIGDFTTYLMAQIRKLPIQIELGQTATPGDIERSNPDVLILATGVLPVIPDIPGISRDNVVTAEDVLLGKARVGQKVVVIGGELVGCETAEFLAERGKDITIVRRGAMLATQVVVSIREKLLPRLAARGVAVLTGVSYQEITGRCLRLTTADGSGKSIDADTIVLAAGSRPNRELLAAVQGKVPQIHVIGDCAEPRNIMEAVADGARIARLVN